MARLTRLKPQLRSLAPRLSYLDPNRDAGRRAINEARRWYSTARWRRLRWHCLERDDFTCQICGQAHADTSKLVADHVEPHRGAAALFWCLGNLQCLCAPCHNSTKQREEIAARGCGGSNP